VVGRRATISKSEEHRRRIFTPRLAQIIPEADYRSDVDVLLRRNVVTQHVETADPITNELIGEINQVDAAKIAGEATAYRDTR
jgi:hypothetical protein